MHGYITFQYLNLAYTEFKPVQKQVMSHLPQNLLLVSSGELTITKLQNPAQGRRSKAEGNRRRWIRTLMQFLWKIYSVFIGILILCLTSKVYMKIIVLDLWEDSSRIQFRQEYSAYGGRKGDLKSHLIDLIWEKIMREEMWSIILTRNVISLCYHQKKIYSNGRQEGIIGLNCSDMPT